MKLATFSQHGGAAALGVVLGEEIVDLGAAAPSLPREMTAFLAAGRAAREAAAAAVEHPAARIPLDDVRLEPTVCRPPKILAIGVNYLPVSVPPLGLSADGLPVGVQIVGPFLGDRTCIDLAMHVERVIDGYQPPPIARQ